VSKFIDMISCLSSDLTRKEFVQLTNAICIEAIHFWMRLYWFDANLLCDDQLVC
jgi:hypothetical protein